MQLAQMTWPEVDDALQNGICAVLPVGSTEQHGPMGLIGTDTICANAVALAAAKITPAIVAPPLAYTPAPFNTSFPGTISVTPDLLTSLVQQICSGLLDQGFCGVFVVNGHGANVLPIQAAFRQFPARVVKMQSWWAPSSVMHLRQKLYGEWEGMHATPSEVAITQALSGARPAGSAAMPPRQLSAEYMRAHSGDKHGPPDEHRAAFPDGRVGSHSALANPKDGHALLDTASNAIAKEIDAFTRDLLCDG